MRQQEGTRRVAQPDHGCEVVTVRLDRRTDINADPAAGGHHAAEGNRARASMDHYQLILLRKITSLWSDCWMDCWISA
jgi:hypothetical protein